MEHTGTPRHRSCVTRPDGGRILPSVEGSPRRNEIVSYSSLNYFCLNQTSLGFLHESKFYGLNHNTLWTGM